MTFSSKYMYMYSRSVTRQKWEKLSDLVESVVLCCSCFVIVLVVFGLFLCFPDYHGFAQVISNTWNIIRVLYCPAGTF